MAINLHEQTEAQDRRQQRSKDRDDTEVTINCNLCYLPQLSFTKMCIQPSLH